MPIALVVVTALSLALRPAAADREDIGVPSRTAKVTRPIVPNSEIGDDQSAFIGGAKYPVVQAAMKLAATVIPPGANFPETRGERSSALALMAFGILVFGCCALMRRRRTGLVTPPIAWSHRKPISAAFQAQPKPPTLDR